MSHTYTKNHFHIVFSTKGRRKLISKQTQPELWAYMAGICKNIGIWVHAIGGIEDHASDATRVVGQVDQGGVNQALLALGTRVRRETARDGADQEQNGEVV